MLVTIKLIIICFAGAIFYLSLRTRVSKELKIRKGSEVSEPKRLLKKYKLLLKEISALIFCLSYSQAWMTRTGGCHGRWQGKDARRAGAAAVRAAAVRTRRI